MIAPLLYLPAYCSGIVQRARSFSRLETKRGGYSLLLVVLLVV
jgi:hypothetical protein